MYRYVLWVVGFDGWKFYEQMKNCRGTVKKKEGDSKLCLCTINLVRRCRVEKNFQDDGRNILGELIAKLMICDYFMKTIVKSTCITNESTTLITAPSGRFYCLTICTSRTVVATCS